VFGAHRVRYQPGDRVWVGRSRGSERKGTVLRHLGEGSYSVSVAGQEGVWTFEESLLHPRREDDEESRRRRSCPPHTPLLVQSIGDGHYVARCLACGLVGPDREDASKARLAFVEESSKRLE
jgi:hypothetical protein